MTECGLGTTEREGRRERGKRKRRGERKKGGGREERKRERRDDIQVEEMKERDRGRREGS